MILSCCNIVEYLIFVLELVYCGHVLRDDMSLASCGISTGSDILALKKRHLVEPSPKAGTGIIFFKTNVL